jgi:Zn-dependent peptidase ImmA (M78 family)
MSIKSFEVNVNSNVLEYAIESSGYSIENLANEINKKKKSFNFDYLKKIITGEKKPLFSDLEKLDSFLKRGLPFFLLNDIPKEDKILKYRKKSPNLNLSPSTEITLREYNYLREEISYLLTKKEISSKRKTKIYLLNDKPEEISSYFRNKFKFEDLEIEKKKPEDVFKFLRDKMEETNLFIFKNYVTSEKLDDNLRGCVFLESSLPPLILINSNDDKNAEIFTLLHEFAHYLLNKEELDTDEVSDNFLDPIEIWCNDFAYSFLIDSKIEKMENFTKENSQNLIEKNRLTELSKKYKVSKYAFMGNVQSLFKSKHI